MQFYFWLEGQEIQTTRPWSTGCTVAFQEWVMWRAMISLMMSASWAGFLMCLPFLSATKPSPPPYMYSVTTTLWCDIIIIRISISLLLAWSIWCKLEREREKGAPVCLLLVYFLAITFDTDHPLAWRLAHIIAVTPSFNCPKDESLPAFSEFTVALNEIKWQERNNLWIRARRIQLSLQQHALLLRGCPKYILPLALSLHNALGTETPYECLPDNGSQ